MARRTAAARRSPSVVRRLLLALTLSVGVSAAAPHTARADDDEPEHYDARVQGYTPAVEPTKAPGLGMVWVLTVLLLGGCVGVMFMNPKRSHLD